MAVKQFFRSVRDSLMNQNILRPFLVNPSSGKNLAYMDGIRAIAVCFVLFYHCWILSGQLPLQIPLGSHHLNFTPIIASGFTGVELFFVLSGFLLSQAWLRANFLQKARPELRKYFRQRFFRLVPGYYFCILFVVITLTPLLIPSYQVYSPLGAFNLSAHLLFLQYVFSTTGGSYTVDGALWTLTIEVAFYFALPLIVWAFYKNRWLISLPVAAALTLGWLYISTPQFGLNTYIFYAFHTPPLVPGHPDSSIHFNSLGLQFPGHLVDFAFGISLANVFVRYQLKRDDGRLFRLATSTKSSIIYFVTGWVILIALMYKYQTPSSSNLYYYFHEMLVSLGFTLIIAGVLFGEAWIQAVFSAVPLRFMGIIGYTVFMIHMPLIYVYHTLPGVAHLSPKLYFFSTLIVVTITAILFATGVFLLIEKPFILLGRRQNDSTPKVSQPETLSQSIGLPGRTNTIQNDETIKRPAISRITSDELAAP